ncbi:O-antigen ligase family protein [Rathayibacter soli]|uniref:O-antigen ligase family protein n=1 Tax=Rathayibacter soli TaxID=3144168 RepID=UPI0027E3D0EB|nr:O-antigen ligase family protein [Glaciibacter superstes]
MTSDDTPRTGRRRAATGRSTNARGSSRSNTSRSPATGAGTSAGTSSSSNNNSSSTSIGAHTRSGSALGLFAAFALFTLFAGDFWRNLIGWGGYLTLAALVTIGSVVWLIVLRPKPPARWLPFRKMPKTLALFLVLATVSIAWSFYPGASALGVAAQWCTTAAGVFLALCLTWKQLLRALGTALRWLIGLSLLFELIVAAFVRHPVLPFWVHYDQHTIPQAFYWSRGLLFHGGQLQGIQGNSNLLAMSTLLALIVFSVQLADRTVKRGWGLTWLIAAVVTFLLTRSSTVIIAAILVALVLLLALWTRRRDPRKRAPVYATAFGVIVVGIASAVVLWGPILKLLGKSEDLTGRLTIWKAVTDLALQRPVFGWGWISYWAPWVEPFKTLAIRKGVTYLQAHNAYLDVWMQLGIIGLIIFILLVGSTLGRSWFAAVDRPRTGPADTARYTAITLLPLLLIAALIAQSAAESRMLSEGGWALLVLLAVKTKADRP